MKYFLFINIHFGTKIYFWRKSNLSWFLHSVFLQGLKWKSVYYFYCSWDTVTETKARKTTCKVVCIPLVDGLQQLENLELAFRIFLSIKCWLGWRRDASGLVVTVGAIRVWCQPGYLIHWEWGWNGDWNSPGNVQCGCWVAVRLCVTPGRGFPPPRWARHNCGAAEPHRGDLPVPPGCCRAAFVGRKVFLRVCFWIKTMLVMETVGSLPLASVRAAPPRCLLWGADLGDLPQEGSWSPPIPEEHSPTSKVWMSPSRKAQPGHQSQAHELFASAEPLLVHRSICKGRYACIT